MYLLKKFKFHPDIMKLKGGDYIIVFCAAFASIFLMLHFFAVSSEGRMVEITGKNYFASYPLNEVKSIDVPGPLGITRVEILNGEAWVSVSPCREKICIKMGKISRVGEQIVCLPNRVVVEIRGGKSDIDGVSR